MKAMSVKKQALIGFAILDVLIIVSIFLGYLEIKKVANNPDLDVDVVVQQYSLWMLGLLVLFIGDLAYIGYVLLFRLSRGIGEVIKASKKMASGDLNIKFNDYKEEEIKGMIDGYKSVVESVKSQAEIAEQVADGDLTVNVVVKSEKDVLGNAIHNLVDKNLHALTSIRDAAIQVNNSSSQVASASESLAQGSTEQASAIQEITSSIDDIASKTKDNAMEADKAAELMRHALENVDSGKENMAEMMAAMQDINQSSESISKIIKVIDDIAFQTNILALNAAVEAARAGEAGKGFAVVAEEVRSLAAKSAAAASETAELIEDSIEKVATGSKIADATSKAIGAITGVVEESEKIVAKIAEASNQQATAIEQVDQAIEQVSMVVQNNSATSEECAAASIELSNQSGKMKELLSVYNLGNGKKAKAPKKSEDDTSKAERNEQIISLGSGFGKY